jgi:hypothetical protein
VAQELLLFQGGEIKARGNDILKGIIVRSGSPDDTDRSLKCDFFAPETNLGPHSSGVCMYHHGTDEAVGKSIWGETSYSDK